MKKSTKRKIMVITLALALVLCLYYVSSTYAKYASSATANSTVDVAKWAIKLGTVDITASSDFTNQLTLSPDASTYVSAGKIAPSTTASGSFIIDPTGAEVAMKYTIEIGTLSYDGNEQPNFVVKSVKAGGEAITATNGVYTGTISLSEVEKGTTVEIEVTVEWESTSDTADTAVGLESGTLTVPVTVTVEQYTGA